MRKKNIILIGGGGHCESVIDVIENSGMYSIKGILDKDKVGKKILGYKVIGNDDAIEKLSAKNCFHISVGQIKSPELRKKIFDKVKKANGVLPVIISPRAYVSKNAKISEGTIVMHNAVVNSSAQVGSNCILNTSCIIEHNSAIGSHTHISTMAVVNADCRVGEGVFISSNVCVNRGIAIGNNVIIGAGSVVTRNIQNNEIAWGVPAISTKKNDFKQK